MEVPIVLTMWAFLRGSFPRLSPMRVLAQHGPTSSRLFVGSLEFAPPCKCAGSSPGGAARNSRDYPDCQDLCFLAQ